MAAFVLVVDDHQPVAEAVATLLRSDGHEAETVHSGPAALAFVRARAVDLVVLDVSMPGMSGLDVLRALRADGTVPGLSVVMFSASDETRDEALRLGASGFIHKGDADTLIDLLSGRGAGDVPAGASAGPSSA